MNAQYWSIPVDVTLAGWNNRRTITATCYAREALLTLWPDNRRGDAYFRALRTCGEAMRGLEQPAAARSAFIAAAREAKILTIN